MAMGRALKELTPSRSRSHQLGAELRHWRLQRKLSQDELGRAVHHSGSLVGRIEKADRVASLQFCVDADVVLRTGGVLARMFRAATETGPDTGVEAPRVESELVAESLRWVDDLSRAVALTCQMWRSEVDRRGLLASTVWVASGFSAPLGSWLRGEADLLPKGGGRRVGRADVDALWSMCSSFTDADHRLGGGYARSTLMHYLDTVVRPLLTDGAYNEQTGRDLLGAAARLCGLCAFMSFDSGEQGLAQRYFVQALRLSHASGSRALSGHILGDMSMQAHHLGDGARALQLAEAGYRAGVDVGSSSTAARCAILSGRANALRGDSAAAARDRLCAEQRLDATPVDAEPTWIQFFTTQQLAVESQYLASDLGDHREVRRIAEELGPPSRDMQRRRVLSTATLAEACLPESAGGDVEYACALLGDVLPVLPALTSARARGRVDGVRRRLSRFADHRGVCAFEERFEQIVLASTPA
jgi:hypothetical protein